MTGWGLGSIILEVKLKIASDLHLEFHDDNGLSIIKKLSVNQPDVLVLAGDICSFSMLSSSLKKFCDEFRHVVYVLGNHEYYGHFQNEVLDLRDSLSIPNLHWLHRSACTIDDITFAGASLWYRISIVPDPDESLMSDFRCIKNIRRSLINEHVSDRKFIIDNSNADVIITHFLPSHLSTHPKYEHSPINKFFVSDMTDFIETSNNLWIHGHTHESFDYRIEQARVLCNPYGYEGHEVNENFDFECVVEL